MPTNQKIYSFIKDDNFGKFYLAAKNYNLVRQAYPELPEMQTDDALIVIVPKQLVAMCQLLDILEELEFIAVGGEVLC